MSPKNIDVTILINRALHNLITNFVDLLIVYNNYNQNSRLLMQSQKNFYFFLNIKQFEKN